MFRLAALPCAFALLVLAPPLAGAALAPSLAGAALAPSLAGAAPAASPVPAATPTPNAEAERDFARAREYWRARSDVPYVRYGALVRYLHDGHVFDNWWDANYRSSDGALALVRLVDVAEERHRLGGIPFSIFGLKIFDTNPDAEPIRLDEPRLAPGESFGVGLRGGPSPAPSSAAAPLPLPAASGSGDLREIWRVEVNARAYDIEIAGNETVAGASALHLTLRPLRDPGVNRLRDLWLDPQSFRTVQTRVQGIFNGKPYDGVAWTVHYTIVDGREYLQQIVADEPLHFGLDTEIPKMEFDFVDYRFPKDVPKFTFDRPFGF